MEQESLVSFPVDSVLKEQLNDCVIPYLSPAGSFFPEKLYSIFPSILGNCIRTKNADMVDFAYEMRVLSRNDGNLYSAIGLVEMKDWRKDLKNKDVVDILRRIPFSEYSLLTTGHFWGRCKLHFIFCRSLKLEKIPKGKTANQANMESHVNGGFSRQGYSLNTGADRSSYSTFIEAQGELNEQKKSYNKKMKDFETAIAFLETAIRAEDASTMTESEKENWMKVNKKRLEKLKRSMEKARSNSSLRIRCYDSYDSSKDEFKMEESEKQKAEKLMPPKKISLNALLINQKINLYYVEAEKDGSYRLKVICEDPSHDLISIIFPLQRSLDHMGTDNVSAGNTNQEHMIDKAAKAAEEDNDSLDVTVIDSAKHEDFDSYLSNDLIKAIGNLYRQVPVDLSAGQIISQDNTPSTSSNFRQLDSQAHELSDTGSDDGSAVTQPKVRKIN